MRVFNKKGLEMRPINLSQYIWDNKESTINFTNARSVGVGLDVNSTEK